jgi:hypothetical protein
MEVQVPERVDILALVGADLPVLEALLGGLGSRCTTATAQTASLEHPVGLHIAAQRLVGGHRTQPRILLTRTARLSVCSR